jgi:glucose/mannose-6-phosphate isomerase
MSITTTTATSLSTEVIKDGSSLVIIVCYSGWSVEPCLFFESMREMTGNRNLIVLRSGGKIAALCKEHGTSLIQYKLKRADHEYPLYHVQQFFSIFLDLFYKLKITKSSYQSELEDSIKFLKAEFHEGTLKRAEAIAVKLRGAVSSC